MGKPSLLPRYQWIMILEGAVSDYLRCVVSAVHIHTSCVLRRGTCLLGTWQSAGDNTLPCCTPHFTGKSGHTAELTCSYPERGIFFFSDKSDIPGCRSFQGSPFVHTSSKVVHTYQAWWLFIESHHCNGFPAYEDNWSGPPPSQETYNDVDCVHYFHVTFQPEIHCSFESFSWDFYVRDWSVSVVSGWFSRLMDHGDCGFSSYTMIRYIFESF